MRDSFDLNGIAEITIRHNSDNITRTVAYQNFYFKHPEIRWALLASMVSRNAGWNMTDLSLLPFQKILTKKVRQRLFMTYERANWLIFSDAYPQLLMYELSKENNQPLFHLLRKYHVSYFMIREWQRFWETKDVNRLTQALIINEQNVIENPVIRQHFFSEQVFKSIPYLLETILKLNAVIFPTVEGELYGIEIHRFTHLDERIAVGHTLTDILFNPELFQKFINFILMVPPTGSREEYENFLTINGQQALPLRSIFPKVDHQDIIRQDWLKFRGCKQKWWLVKYERDTRKDISHYYVKKRLIDIIGNRKK
nr:DUF2515 family protein [Thalassobacillus pellis]